MKRRNIAEQMFNDAINTIKESQTDLERTISGYTSGGVSSRPLIDIIEDDNQVIVKTDLPGFKKENIKIDISEDALEIMARFEEEILTEGANYVKKERKYDEVKRIVDLPAKVKIDDSNAAFENGVLTVTLPKMQMKENFRVQVD